MIKRLLALLLVSTLLLTACNSEIKNEDTIRNDSKIVDGTITADNHMDFDVNPEIFSDLSDENLLQYVEDEVYAGITEQLASEDYIVESVDAIYISKEYLEEAEYNSQKNRYFGYTLSELDAQYDGMRYVFTLGDDGQTTTKTFEKYDDTYEQVMKNVAIGTGIILVCATVSVASAGVGAPMYDFAKENNTHILTYIDDEVVSETESEYIDVEVTLTKMPHNLTKSFKETVNKPAVKCMLLEEPTYLKEVEAKLKATYGDKYSIAISKPFFLEVTKLGVDKGVALRKLVETLGLKIEESIAVGDSYNDLPMLKAAGLAACVENANEDIKKVCSFISKSNNDGGMAYLIDKLIFNK